MPPAAATFLSQVDWPAAEKGIDLVGRRTLVRGRMLASLFLLGRMRLVGSFVALWISTMPVDVNEDETDGRLHGRGANVVEPDFNVDKT